MLSLRLFIDIPGNHFADNNEKPGLNKLYNQAVEIQTEVYFKLDKLVDRKLPKFFLGLSLLSFIEIFDFIMEAAFLVKETFKKKKKNLVINKNFKF